MAWGAASIVMTSPEDEEIRVVEGRGRLNHSGAQLHRIAHAEGKKPFNKPEMAAACRNVVEAGPGQ
jgi:hypothetical protein